MNNQTQNNAGDGKVPDIIKDLSKAELLELLNVTAPITRTEYLTSAIPPAKSPASSK